MDKEIKRKPSNKQIISISALDFAKNKIAIDINVIKKIPLTVLI